MKITLVLASVAAYVYAGEGECCEDLGEYDPKCIPEALEGPDNWKQRWEEDTRPNGKKMKIGSHSVKRSQLKGLPRQCKKGARQFDKYCHQFKIKDGNRRKTPKYTDYTKGTGVCAFEDDDLSQAICLGQQCMFEYCIYRRDEWLEICEDEDGEVELPVEEPGWGDVYDYGNMHADLNTNTETDGDFESGVCTEYYRFMDENGDEIDAKLEGDDEDDEDGEDGEDDEDDEDESDDESTYSY